MREICVHRHLKACVCVQRECAEWEASKCQECCVDLLSSVSRHLNLCVMLYNVIVNLYSKHIYNIIALISAMHQMN